MNNSNDTPLIEVCSLGKVFRSDATRTQVFDKLSFAVQSGEYTAITGPSGCGKSTLLNILGMLDHPTAGSYLYNGQRVDRLSREEMVSIRNREIGFIFQDCLLIDDLTVRENVELPLLLRDGLGVQGIQARVKRTLGQVGMSLFEKHFPGSLSAGQRQRVAVARALAGSPSLLLADEPTGNLDTAEAHNIMELLSELHAMGSTLCIVSHNQKVLRNVQRVIELPDKR